MCIDKVRKSGSLVLLLALFVAGCAPSGLRMPQSPMLGLLERKSGLIVYVGADGNIYTIDQGGGHKQAVTGDAQKTAGFEGRTLFYEFPTWSPDGKRLAFVGISSLNGSIEDVILFTTAPDGSNLVENYHSQDEYPFYLYWSPDSQRISILTAPKQGDELSLHILPADGGPATRVTGASQLFWSWSPDNRSLLVHRGGAAKDKPDSDLSIVDISNEIQETTLEFLPSAFHAPAWSPDGKHLLLGAEKEDGQAALFLTDEQGSQQEALADLFGQSFFGWSPDSQRIAFVSGDAQASDESVQVLTVLDPEQPENKIALQEELFAGFFWSPDSRRLAYFLPSLVAPTPEPGGQEEQVLFLEVKVLDVRRGDTTQVGVFRPTNQFITMLAAFDQYQYSWSLWSPDSRNLVLSATGTSGEDGIYILEAAANLQPRFLANGGLGLWSWR